MPANEQTIQPTPRLAAALCLGSASFLLLWLLHALGLVERLELIALDARYHSGIGRKAPADDIVIAWIDQESMDHVDFPFPWPRSVYQQAMAYMRAGGARTIVFDVLFDQPAHAEEDAEFGAALQQNDGDVLAMQFMTSRTGARTEAATQRFWERALTLQGPLPLRDREHGLLLPLAELEAGADLLGFVNIRPDADKTYRHYDALRSWAKAGSEPRVFPSLALAAAMRSKGATSIRRSEDGELSLPGGPSSGAAADTAARLLLNFRGPEFTFPHVKFVNILESINLVDSGKAPLYPAERFRDKIVLIGINAEGYADAHPTPLSPVFPGVELHATALDNLLRGDSLRAPRWDLQLAAAAVAVVSAVVFLLPSVAAAVAVLLLLALAGIGAALLCWQQLLVVPMAAPALGGATAAGSSFLWRLVVEGRQKREIRRAFASYLAPEVMQKVLRDPDQLALGGRTRDVTLLFTDLAGFTALAEHADPPELVAFLNDYFTRMCEPLLAEHGVIDKFIGDSIMALFGAPLDAPDHARRAVRAAVAARAVSEQIAEGLRRQGLPAIATRIGIHSGPAVVGNMGSRKRFDYTAIGDTVNLASRLEGANKALGTVCLVSEATWAQVGDEVLGREVGLVAVQGRRQPVAVFEPLQLRATATASELDRSSRHAEAIAALRTGDRKAAQAGFAALLASRPTDGLAGHYLARLTDPAWDGVFRLDSK